MVAESESTNRRPRPGVIEEVLRGEPSPRYRIRWDDGHETIYTPASGALRAEHPQPRRLQRADRRPDRLGREHDRESALHAPLPSASAQVLASALNTLRLPARVLLGRRAAASG